MKLPKKWGIQEISNPIAEYKRTTHEPSIGLTSTCRIQPTCRFFSDSLMGPIERKKTPFRAKINEKPIKCARLRFLSTVHDGWGWGWSKQHVSDFNIAQWDSGETCPSSFPIWKTTRLTWWKKPGPYVLKAVLNKDRRSLSSCFILTGKRNCGGVKCCKDTRHLYCKDKEMWDSLTSTSGCTNRCLSLLDMWQHTANVLQIIKELSVIH